MSLQTILRWNGASCVAFGASFAVAPGRVARFLGDPPAPAAGIALLGVLLFLHGLHLFHASRGAGPSRWLVGYFSTGDFAWTAGTVALVAGRLWINEPAGVGAALLVGVFVGALGVLQLREMRRTARD